MKYLRIVLVVIWKIWFYLLMVLCAIFLGFIIYITTYQKNERIPYYFMRLWAYVAFYGAGFTYTLKDSQKLDPQRNYILVANHTSLMDIALMLILHPNHPIVFVGKKELEKIPLFGRVYRKIAILVDRSDRKSREAVFSAVRKAILVRNETVVFFPEGGVPDRDIILGKFKDGAFVLSESCKTPIVVYAFHNLKNLFPFVFTLGHPGRVKIEKLTILSPEGETTESMRGEIYEMIYNQIKDDKIEYPEIK